MTDSSGERLIHAIHEFGKAVAVMGGRGPIEMTLPEQLWLAVADRVGRGTIYPTEIRIGPFRSLGIMTHAGVITLTTRNENQLTRITGD